jgi:hypothetical protein
MTGVQPRAAAVSLLVYVALAVLLTANAWSAPTTRWIGGCCDPEQSMWFLRWIPYAIEHLVDPFVTYQINAPTGVNLMWNSAAPLLSLALAPVTLLGGPILAYNVAIVASVALSAWCTCLLLARITTSPIASLVGGAVYGFSPYVVSHMVLHLNLTAVWIPPLFVLLLHELVVGRRRSPRMLGAAVGLLAAGQLLIFEEVLATSAVSGALLVAVLAVVGAHRRMSLREPARRVVAAILPAGLTFGVLTAWPLAVQFLGPQRIDSQVQNLETFSTDLLNVVVPTRYQLFSPDVATKLSDEFSGLYHEATGYLGVPLLVLLTVVVIVRWSDLRIRVAGTMAVLLLVASFGPVLQVNTESTGIPMPWALISQAPLIEHALPGRLTVYLWLAIAVIVAITVDHLRRLPVRRAATGLLLVAVAIAVAAPAPMRWWSVDVPVFFERWDDHGIRDDAIVLLAPYFTNGAGADPMLWAAVAGNEIRMYEAYAYVPMPDGRPTYGPPPTQLSRVMEGIQDRGVVIIARGGVREAIELELAESGITDVIVGSMRHRGQMVAFFTDLFGTPPVEIDGVALWRDVQQTGVAPAPD